MAWTPWTAHSTPLPQWGSGGSRQGPRPTGFLSWRLVVGSPPLAAAAGAQGAAAGSRMQLEAGAAGLREGSWHHSGSKSAPVWSSGPGLSALGPAAEYLLPLKTRYTHPLPPTSLSLCRRGWGEAGEQKGWGCLHPTLFSGDWRGLPRGT